MALTCADTAAFLRGQRRKPETKDQFRGFTLLSRFPRRGERP